MVSRTALFLAIDVGTDSARAALFTSKGQNLGYAEHRIKRREPQQDHYEQSSADIWNAIKSCVQTITKVLQSIPESYVASIGIDATCSLVACKEQTFHPLSISEDDVSEEWNVMLWLDRRAQAEAEFINNFEDPHVAQVRKHFGGRLSPENEPPKVLWLLRNKPHVIADGVFFDLADWVAFKCVGDDSVRSACTVACKWGWGSNVGSEGKWIQEFWQRLGLDVLCERGFYKIGSRILQPGQQIGHLSKQAAEELGLTTECVVAVPMIDAHCGAIWSLGAECEELKEVSIEQRVSLIAGTSTCFIQIRKDIAFVQGVWGPFRDAVLGEYWCTEGGQSVTGKLLEETVKGHVAYETVIETVGKAGVYDFLASGGEERESDLHVLDYHAGNRSPRADASLKGMVSGLGIGGVEELKARFRATIQGIVYGARHVIEAMGGKVGGVIMACGGVCKSELFLRELADATGMIVVLATEENTVLLGGAIVARSAWKGGLIECAREMVTVRKVLRPAQERRVFHERKYRVYKEMYNDFLKYRRIMRGEED